MLIKDEVDIGVLIHEGRFIYPSLGFKLIVDLGDFWKKETGTPIPLGCIVLKKDLKIKSVLEELIRNSINYAFENKDEVFKFVRSYAQELDEKVIISHIETYVNNYTFNMTDKGLLSMETLMNKIEQEGVWGLRNL
jgi:1,4-dihydroxy-6-naphthoate synthase